MAQITFAASSRFGASRAPGSGRGSRLSWSKSAPARRSITWAAAASMGVPAAAATSTARRRPSMPIMGSNSERAAPMPNSPKTASHASIRAATVSTSVPSRSKTTAAGRAK